MTTRRRTKSDETPRRPAATTLEGRENQLAALAYDLTERQLRDGSASSQQITHFLKMGSTRELLEQQRIRHENEMTKQKIEFMASQVRMESMYKDALAAMQYYKGGDDVPPPPGTGIGSEDVL